MGISPETPDGHVYYARLATPKGRFYKIGFTKMASVEERFSYDGSDAYKLIDKVFLFKYSPYAYQIETEYLHGHLSTQKAYKGHGLKSLFRDSSKLPLFGDGQTELYQHDVLGLDPDYRPPRKWLGRFSKNRHDLLNKNSLDFNHYWEGSRAEASSKVNRTIRAFLSAPHFYTKDDFIRDNGQWVVKLNKWAALNAMQGIEGKTIHGTTSLPQTKDQLLELKKFSPKWGWVKSFPDEVGQLTNLEVIRVNSIGVSTLPSSLFKLKKVRVLDISGSSIDRLPDELANMLSLEVLILGNGENIVSLPKLESMPPKLKRIRLFSENIPKFQSSFPDLAHLVRDNFMITWKNGYRDDYYDIDSSD